MSQSAIQSSRRELLKTAGSVAAGMTIPTFITSTALGAPGVPPASERIRVGCIGLLTMGLNNLNTQKYNTVALCDVDKNHLAEAYKRVKKDVGRECDTYTDYRKLLERKDIDAVVLSVPDHWHAKMTVEACQAGKHVYCEKPLSLTVADGQAMVKAARYYKRIVQTGSQQRSSEHFRNICEFIRNGGLGKVHTVRAGIGHVNFKGKPVPDSDPPPELNYEIWQGPAPKRPYNERHVHYNFRFFWDYSGGQMTNWGAHFIDVAHWGLGFDHGGPMEVEGTAQYHEQGWYEVPKNFEAIYKYPGDITMHAGMKYPLGTEFEGTRGKIFITRSKVTFDPPDLYTEPLPKPFGFGQAGHDHHQSWMEGIKTGKLPTADVNIGHHSAIACHLGNIAIRLKRKVKWDAARQQIIGDPEAAKMLNRPYRAPWLMPEMK